MPSSIPILISTERLLLRPIRKTDAAALFELVGNNRERIDEDFPLTIRSTRTPGKTEAYVHHLLDQRKRRMLFTYGIWKDKGLLGYIAIRNIDWKTRQCELAYFIDKASEGNGFATEAVKAACSFCFERLELSKIRIRAELHNLPSQRVAMKAGFQKEATVKDEFRRMKGKPLELVHFGLTRSDINQHS